MTERTLIVGRAPRSNLATTLGWHFTTPCIGSRILVNRTTKECKVGEWVSVTGNIRICEWGLHWSRTPLQAAWFRRGMLLCRVRVTAPIDEFHTRRCFKAVSRYRKILWTFDTRRLFRVRMDVNDLIAYINEWGNVEFLRRVNALRLEDASS